MNEQEFQAKITFYLLNLDIIIEQTVGKDWRHKSGYSRLLSEYEIICRFLENLRFCGNYLFSSWLMDYQVSIFIGRNLGIYPFVLYYNYMQEQNAVQENQTTILGEKRKREEDESITSIKKPRNEEKIKDLGEDFANACKLFQAVIDFFLNRVVVLTEFKTYFKKFLLLVVTKVRSRFLGENLEANNEYYQNVMHKLFIVFSLFFSVLERKASADINQINIEQTSIPIKEMINEIRSFLQSKNNKEKLEKGVSIIEQEINKQQQEFLSQKDSLLKKTYILYDKLRNLLDHLISNCRLSVEYKNAVRIVFEKQCEVVETKFQYFKLKWSFSFYKETSGQIIRRLVALLYILEKKGEDFENLSKSYKENLAEIFEKISFIKNDHRKKMILNKEVEEVEAEIDEYYLNEEASVETTKQEPSYSNKEGENDCELSNNSDEEKYLCPKVLLKEEDYNPKYLIQALIKYLQEFLNLPLFVREGFNTLWQNTISEFTTRSKLSSLDLEFPKNSLNESFISGEKLEINSNEEKVSHKKTNIFEFVPALSILDLASISRPNSIEFFFNTELNLDVYFRENQAMLLCENN